MKRLLKLLMHPFWRDADLAIGGRTNPYMLRWHVIPRNRLFNIYLHKIMRSDDDRALHDHPWKSLSIILRGGYIERHVGGFRLYGRGDVIWRGERFRHRLELVGGEDGITRPCWTLFFTGRRLRTWGFWCKDASGRSERFVPWTDFVDDADRGRIGRGCGEQG